MDEFDLVVVGSGASGLTGALVAAIEGARVVVLEKTELVGGTTSMSGGGVYVPNNRHMGDVGVSDSREEALEYLRACTGSLADDSHLVALVDEGPKMLEFIEDKGGVELVPWPSIGGTIEYRPWLPGSKHGGRTVSSPRFDANDLGDWMPKLRIAPMSAWRGDPLDYYAKRMHLAAPDDPMLALRTGEAGQNAYGRGTALIGQLLRGCLAQGVEVLVSTPAKELIVEDGRVVGVIAEQGGVRREFRARHGVLMATGGFSHNEELKRLWLDRPLEFACEIEENQGDGHLMGIAVGAQTAGLGDAWWMPQLEVGGDKGVVNAGGSREDRILPHTMMVNSAGRRFMNEAVNYYDAGESFGLKVGAAPRDYPAWYVFDQQGVERYAMLSWKLVNGKAPDWLLTDDTIEGLAEKMGVDPVALASTTERFNGFARSGVDEDFHRGESGWDVAWGDPTQTPNPSLGTIEKGPFYASRVFSGALATRGGLQVNDRGEVLAALTGEPIPGLMAAGNCSNGGPAGSYPGAGATLGAGMTFGYIIGLRIGALVGAAA